MLTETVLPHFCDKMPEPGNFKEIYLSYESLSDGSKHFDPGILTKSAYHHHSM